MHKEYNGTEKSEGDVYKRQDDDYYDYDDNDNDDDDDDVENFNNV